MSSLFWARVNASWMRPPGRGAAKRKALDDASPFLDLRLFGGLVQRAEDRVGQRGVQVEWNRRLHVLMNTYFSYP